MNTLNATVISNLTNSSVSNVTIADNKFTEEYVVFNYIMVGVSCCLLLIVIIIAKLLCIFNRNADYDNLNSSPVMSGEKALFHTEDLQNISEEMKRSSPVTDSIVSRRFTSSAACPRSANSTSAYYHDVPTAKGVWHTDDNHPLEQGVGDFFLTNSDKQRLSLELDPEPIPKPFRFKSPLSIYSQSAPLDNQFLHLESSQHRLPMCKWPAPNSATTVNASAPDCSLLFTHCESQTKPGSENG